MGRGSNQTLAAGFSAVLGQGRRGVHLTPAQTAARQAEHDQLVWQTTPVSVWLSNLGDEGIPIIRLIHQQLGESIVALHDRFRRPPVRFDLLAPQAKTLQTALTDLAPQLRVEIVQPDSLPECVEEAIDQARKITAVRLVNIADIRKMSLIKAIRATTSLNLRQAKDWLDQSLADGELAPPLLVATNQVEELTNALADLAAQYRIADHPRLLDPRHQQLFITRVGDADATVTAVASVTDWPVTKVVGWLDQGLPTLMLTNDDAASLVPQLSAGGTEFALIPAP